MSEEPTVRAKGPGTKVGARDIDGMVGHLRLLGKMETNELRKLVEGQMDRLEIEVTSELVDCLEAMKRFRAIADTQIVACTVLDQLEERLKLLKPYLLLIMERRSHDHFLRRRAPFHSQRTHIQDRLRRRCQVSLLELPRHLWSDKADHHFPVAEGKAFTPALTNPLKCTGYAIIWLYLERTERLPS